MNPEKKLSPSLESGSSLVFFFSSAPKKVITLITVVTELAIATVLDVTTSFSSRHRLITQGSHFKTRPLRPGIHR